MTWLSCSSMAFTQCSEQYRHTAGWQKEKTVTETTDSRTRLNITGALNLKDITSTIARGYGTISSENITFFYRYP